MKELYLLRHAKSAWDEHGLTDRERGLNARGRRSSPAMGRALSQWLSPMALDVSTARRAQLTLEGICLGWPGLERLDHRTHESLYTFDAADLVGWLSHCDDRDTAIFLIGHNPAFTDLVNYLCTEQWLDNLPTAGFASMTLEIDQWRDLRQGCGTLQKTLFPRQLENN